MHFDSIPVEIHRMTSIEPKCPRISSFNFIMKSNQTRHCHTHRPMCVQFSFADVKFNAFRRKRIESNAIEATKEEINRARKRGREKYIGIKIRIFDGRQKCNFEMDDKYERKKKSTNEKKKNNMSSTTRKYEKLKKKKTKQAKNNSCNSNDRYTC